MYIESGQVFKWRQRKRKKNIVSIFNRYIVMVPLVLAGTAGLALAGPTGGVITGGSGGIETSGSATNISQSSPRLDINWNTFSTEVHESINFAQPTAEAIALNRVIGGVPSELRGALNANGRVFILNDSGITFFGTSQVNVGALLATTATDVLTDGDSLSFSGAGYGTVLNQGSIHVSDGGFAVLAAPYVANTGFIQANLGTIELASANDFTVDFRGDGLIGFTISKTTLDGLTEAGKALGIDNTGTLQAGSGSIGISAAAASSIVQSVVNLDGIVDASSFGVGADGGTVLVASVGDINIGGEVHADGGVSGNGGTVTTWADGTNIFGPGSVITARGGDVSGDGGFIEVSGNDVRVRGTANASAPNGEAGTFLIDPFSITISNGAGTDSTATVFEQNIENTSVFFGGTNVTLDSETFIHMEALTDDGVLQGGNGAITMTAGDDPYGFAGSITFENKNDKIATTGGAITMTAADGGEGGSGTIDIGHLETLTSGADITLTAGLGGIKTGNLCAGGTADVCGAPRTNNPGDITLWTTGSIETLDVTIYAEDTDSASAYLEMTAWGDLTVGSISLTAIDPDWSNDNATATATLSGGSVEMGNASVTAEGEKIVTAALSVTSWGGDITLVDAPPVGGVTGISVSAIAREGGSDSAVADADISLIAGNDIKINGGVEVNAGATNNVDSSATADADLYMQAYEGYVNIVGDILVRSEATLGAAGAGSASASASADVYGYDINITGDVTVTAVAVNNGTEASNASADASLYMDAYNDLTITGDMLVNADATAVGYYGDASADAYLVAIAAEGDLNITGDIDVKANADNGDGYYDADAVAIALLTGGNDVNIITGSGTIDVAANAVNDGSGSASAAAVLVAAAGVDGDELTGLAEEIADGETDPPEVGVSEFFAEGDLNIIGDVKVTARADSAYGNADAVAVALMVAGNDTTILTDPITVLADAKTGTGYSSNGYDGYGGADAFSYLLCEAGIGGRLIGYSGSLYITGDISSTALATGTSYSNYYNADAFTGLYAADDITVLGSDPLAYAPTAPGADHARVQSKESGFDEVYYYGDGAEGYYTAELVIEAGGTVTIEPKPLVSDDEHEVISSLEANRVKLIEPLGPGRDPLSIDLDGLVSWATGAGVTSPSGGFALTTDMEDAIARGADPTTVLPSPAAGGIGLSSGLDAYSVGGTDYCDQVVNGYCLPAEGRKTE